MNSNIFSLILCLVLLFGCSKSSRRRNASNNLNNSSSSREIINSEREKSVIKMEKVGGVFQIPVEVNGVKMSFIFDTGASSISISNTEALFLAKQGLLTEEDVIGKQNFIDAKGEISEGTIIMLRSIKIGNKTLKNVEASVVDNLNAPLLLGQSALSRFGSIRIDNVKGELILE